MYRRALRTARTKRLVTTGVLLASLLGVFDLALHGASPAGSGPADTANVEIVPRVRPKAEIPGARIRVDSKLVLIPVTVTNAKAQPVLDLPKAAFQVFEDGVEQQITHFTDEDAPLSLGIVFDASGSMEHRLDKSRAAVAQLFRAATPADEYFVVQFSDYPTLLTGFTSDTDEIESSLARIQANGWTALLDAISLAVNECRKASTGRKALLIVSDGGDNRSRFTEREVRAMLRESDVLVYAIGVLGPLVTERSMKLLSNLAEETGGRLFPVHGLADLPEAMEKVSIALHHQYVLGYTPTHAERDGKYRNVLVRVTPRADSPRLHASWRVGYYAPY